MNSNLSELERAAMNDEPMPDGLKVYEQIYFWGLSEIYRCYRNGQIKREEGSKRKKILIRECEQLRQKYEEYFEWCTYYQILYCRISQASSNYAKERTLENADKLYELIYNVSPPK